MLQYGYNRVSLICELYLAGFEFLVLNDAYVLHRGFKTDEQFHPGKAAEAAANRRVFQEFKAALRTHYGTDRECYTHQRELLDDARDMQLSVSV